MNDDGQCAQARLELGVYLLGAIEPAQRALVGRHLAACPQCRAELAGLAGLPSLLRRVPAGETLQLPPDAAALVPGPSLAGRVSGIRRRRWCLTAASAVIAGFAAASGLRALYAGAARQPRRRPGGPSRPRARTRRLGPGRPSGTHPPWGTEVEVRVTGVAAGTRCQFWVTGPRGHDVAAGGWRIAAGDQAAWYPASVPFQAVGVRGFAVIAGGKILVTVQARDQPA